jgi:hypothetical protein
MSYPHAVSSPHCCHVLQSRHLFKTTVKVRLFSVIPAESGIQLYLYVHDELAFPLDCPASQFAMFSNIVAGQ